MKVLVDPSGDVPEQKQLTFVVMHPKYTVAAGGCVSRYRRSQINVMGWRFSWSFFIRIIWQFKNMLLLLHSLTRKQCKMPRQARKLSGTEICQRHKCRHSPAGKTDGCLFRSNTNNAANEKWSEEPSPWSSPRDPRRFWAFTSVVYMTLGTGEWHMM